MISVSQLTKAYGNHLAVDHISFEVEKGQIVGFLGPNGAGKSTTMRMLTCYLPPTSGGATINGFDIFHQSEAGSRTSGLSAGKHAALYRNEGRGVPRFSRPAPKDGSQDAPGSASIT